MDLTTFLFVGLCTLLGVYLFLKLVLIVAWFIYVPVVVRAFSETPFLLADTSQPVSGGEECQFPTSDGLMLRGTYFSTGSDARLGVIGSGPPTGGFVVGNNLGTTGKRTEPVDRGGVG